MNTISSRTPEGMPIRCQICDSEVIVDPSVPPGDATCPNCGVILWFDPAKRNLLTPEERASLAKWLLEKGNLP